MLNASPITIDFHQITEYWDLQTGERFLSNRHWLVATYCEQNPEYTIFYGPKDEVIGRFKSNNVARIRFPEFDPDSPKYRSHANKAFIKSVRDEKPRAYTQWNEEEDIQLFFEKNQGYSLELMAKIHDRPVGGIYMRLFKLGISDGYSEPDLQARQEDRAQKIYKILNPRPSTEEVVITCCGCGLTVWGRDCKCWKVNTGLGNWN